MFEPARLLAFCAAVLVLVLVPGPNTIVIVSQSLSGKRTAALATVAGVELATLAHTMLAAGGVAILLAAAPVSLTILQLAGAAYLIVIGIRATRQQAVSYFESNCVQASVAFRRGLVANLLNPKVAVFFLAFIPQFIDAERGSVFLQFLILGGIVSAVGWCVGAVIALSVSSVAASLRKRSHFARWQGMATGVVLVTVGVWVAVTTFVC